MFDFFKICRYQAVYSVLLVMVMGAASLHLKNAAACTSNIFIVPPQEGAVAGQGVRFTLFVQNPGTTKIISAEYDSVMVTLGLDDQTRTVKATGVETGPDGTVTVPAGGFSKLTYEFLLPRDMAGTVSLTLEDFKSGPVLFAAAPPVAQQVREEENASQGPAGHRRKTN